MTDIRLHSNPTIIAVIDCYLPQTAEIVVEAAGEYSEEVCCLVIQLAANEARERWSIN